MYCYVRSGVWRLANSPEKSYQQAESGAVRLVDQESDSIAMERCQQANAHWGQRLYHLPHYFYLAGQSLYSGQGAIIHQASPSLLS